LPTSVPVLATTATANDRVVTDIAEQLEVGGDGETLVLRGALDRESLHLGVVPGLSAQARLGWLAEHLDELPGSGIIYALTVATAEEVAAFLRERGHTVASYTGKTDPAERALAEEDLLANRVKALVATSALGMGFDKPDLGFVLHLGAPASPIAYYQQIGRAGRGVRRADVLLLPGREDQDIWAYFGSLAFPAERVVRTVLGALESAGRTLSTAALEPMVDLSRSRLEMVLKVLDVDGAVRRVRGGWEATGQAWEYDADRYQRIEKARATESQAMLDYQATSGCRMEFLLRQLDDVAAAPCGRCDNCTGKRWSTEVSVASADAAGERLRRPGVDIAPRKQWPTGMSALDVPLSGKIAAGQLASDGRALGRLTDIGWGTRLRELLAENTQDGPVPEDVFQGCVAVLASWGWARRPVGVVTVSSRRRPELIDSVGARLASVGRLTPLGSVSVGGAGGHRANSARRLAELWSAMSVSAELAGQLSTVDGPVLLVDDLVDSGWTMTLAAKLLRDAGAAEVLPFALASAG
jgi:ATP-dependent DNA helicase RecQ